MDMGWSRTLYSRYNGTFDIVFYWLTFEMEYAPYAHNLKGFGEYPICITVRAIATILNTTGKHFGLGLLS